MAQLYGLEFEWLELRTAEVMVISMTKFEPQTVTKIVHQTAAKIEPQPAPNDRWQKMAKIEPQPAPNDGKRWQKLSLKLAEVTYGRIDDEI